MPFLRTIIERASRRKAFWKRLPTAAGTAAIKVTPDSALRFLLPGDAAWNAMLRKYAAQLVNPGSAVWDIGANVGEFSVAAAKLGGQVLAIEPDPWIASLLMDTSRHPSNRGLRLEPLCAALAKEVGVARLTVAERGRSSSFLEAFGGRSDAGGARYGLTTPVLTMDLVQQAFGPPDVIKIDVEGAEFAVLSGGETVLSQARPVILLEVGNATRVDVFALLKRHRYLVQSVEDASNTDSGAPGGMNWLATPE